VLASERDPALVVHPNAVLARATASQGVASGDHDTCPVPRSGAWRHDDFDVAREQDEELHKPVVHAFQK
jgi:hypothetical protein